MRILLIAGLLLTATAAQAQESRVVEACKAAASYLLTVESVDATVVQDFSDLDPPGARLNLSVGGPFECQFANRESPLDIQGFVLFGEPFTANSEDRIGRRFEEVKYLLEQNGY